MLNTSEEGMSGLDPMAEEESRKRLIEQTKQFAVLFWAVAGLVGIPGNLFVVLAILRSKRLKTVSHILIFNLSLADLCFLLGIPVVVAHVVKGKWVFGAPVCKIFLTSNGINQFASAIFLGVLSLDRYMAVCHPITSRPWRTVNITILVSVCCWVAVTLEMVPVLLFGTLIQDPFGGGTQCMIYWDRSQAAPANCTEEYYYYDDYETNGTETALANLTAYEDPGLAGTGLPPCNQIHSFMTSIQFSRKVFTIYSFLLSFIIPLAGTWFFYGRIIGSLWMRRQQFFQGGNRQRKTAKVTMMGLAIVVMYTLCWLPYWVLQWSIELEAGWTRNVRLLLPISYWAYCTQYLNSALNPFLYAILTDTFRDVVRKALRWGRHKDSTPSQPRLSTFVSPDGHTALTSLTPASASRRSWLPCLSSSSTSPASSRKSSFHPLLERFSLMNGASSGRSKSMPGVRSRRSRQELVGAPAQSAENSALLIASPRTVRMERISLPAMAVHVARDSHVGLDGTTTVILPHKDPDLPILINSPLHPPSIQSYEIRI